MAEFPHKSHLRGLLACLAITLSAGCSSFRGQPDAVFTADAIAAVAKNYALPGAYADYQAKDATERKLYRNEFLFANMAAIDARYDDFRSGVRIERKGLDLGFDALLLGLAGAGSMPTGVANELAVATAGIVGLRGAISRDLYQDRTIAAVIASMDGERFRIAAAMAEKMAREDGDYPLTAAIGDLRAYQLAGTLDDAVTRLERNASAEAAAAKRDYDREVRYACTPSADLTASTQTLGQFNRDIMRAAINETDPVKASAARTRLQQLAALYGVPTQGSNEELAVGIAAAFGAGFCTVTQVDSFKNRVRAAFPAAAL